MSQSRTPRRFPVPVLPGVAVLLVAFLLTQYGYAWRVPFINDDFVFLDVTRGASFPPHSRLFFTDVPSSVGFLAGDGPALRVWYGEPTLRGGLFSSYRVRGAGEPAGADFFFRYDSTAGWVEIRRGAEDVVAARAANPRWREDHEGLAVALSRGGDWAATRVEYAKLAGTFPAQANYPYYAGLAALAAGDSAVARDRLARAATLPSADDEIRAAARVLGRRAHAPPRPGRR